MTAYSCHPPIKLKWGFIRAFAHVVKTIVLCMRLSMLSLFQKYAFFHDVTNTRDSLLSFDVAMCSDP